MSAIRVTEGSAEVTLHSEDLETSDGARWTRYSSRDAVVALLRVLVATGDRETAEAIRGRLSLEGWTGLPDVT